MKNIKLAGIIVLLIVMFLTLCVPNTIYGKGEGTIETDNFDPSKNNPITKSDYSGVMAQTKTIVIVIRTVGIVVAVVGAIAIGIKYMVGSVEQRADYKKTMVPYLIGCFMLFAITSVVSIIYNLTTQIKV